MDDVSMTAERIETEIRERLAGLSARIKDLRKLGRGNGLPCRILRERRFALESLQDWLNIEQQKGLA